MFPSKTEFETILWIRINAGEYLTHKEHVAARRFGLVDAEGHWIGEEAKAEMKKGTADPIWHEGQIIDVPEGAVAVKIECSDWVAVGHHEFVGQVLIPLSELPQSDYRRTSWYAIKPKGQERIAGYVSVKHEYQTVKFQEEAQEKKMAREGTELALLASVRKGSERFIEIRMIKEAAEKLSFVKPDGVLETYDQMSEFFERMGNRDEIWSICGMGLRFKERTCAYFLANQQQEIKKTLHVNLLRLFDLDRDGTIDFNEILKGLSYFGYNKPSVDAERLFLLYDMDKDGIMSHDEMKHFYHKSFHIISEIIRFQIYSTLRRDKLVEKLLRSEEDDLQAMEFISAEINNYLEESKPAVRFTHELWGLLQKEKHASLSLDEWTAFFEASSHDIYVLNSRYVEEMAEDLTKTIIDKFKDQKKGSHKEAASE